MADRYEFGIAIVTKTVVIVVRETILKVLAVCDCSKVDASLDPVIVS